MAKAFTILGMLVSVLMLLVFAADAATGFPFHKASMIVDVGFILCSLIFGFVSWETFREQG